MQPVPAQPAPLRELLPVSNTLVTVPGYGDALGGYLRGVSGELVGDSTASSSGYLTALTEDPDNMALRGRVFEMSLLDGNVPTAVRLARSLPVRDGQVMPALVRLTGDVQQGRMDSAQDDLLLATRVVPDVLQFELLQAYVTIAQGKPIADEIARLEALNTPKVMEARKLFHIARMWQKAGNEPAMVAALEKSNELEPAALFTTLMLGDVYEKQGRQPEAAALYQAFRAKNPFVALLQDEPTRALKGPKRKMVVPTVQQDVAMTLFDFGLLVWGQGAIAPARQVLNLALDLDPANDAFLYYAGIVDESGQAYDAAKAKYAAINPAAPVGLAAKMRLAEAMFREGKHEEGLDLAKKLARARPDVTPFQRSLAEMAFDSQDYATALKAYDSLLKVQDKSTPAPVLAAMYFARGASHERLGHFDAAAKDLNLSLALQPDNPSVMNYLAYMWVEQGKHVDEATVMLERAYQMAPDDGAVMDSLGWAYYQQGLYDKALPFLEQAADITPDDATVFLHLGDVHAKLGHAEEALRYWRFAATLLKPEDDERVRRTLRDRLH